MLAEVAEGARVVPRDADLLVALAAGSAVYAVGVVWFSVDIFFVDRSLGMPKESVGLLWTASGVGGLLGGLVAVAAERNLPPMRMLATGLVVQGAAVTWYALSTDYARALAAAGVSGFGGSLVSVAVGTAMMLRSPPVVLGRVTALFEASGQLSALIALFLLGLQQDPLSPAHTVLICGLLLLASFLGIATRLVLTRS